MYVLQSKNVAKILINRHLSSGAMSAAFVSLHGAQLRSVGFPEALVASLERKLRSEAFDAGDFFTVQQQPNGTRRAVCVAEQGLRAGGDVFLVDHAWSFRAADAHSQLAALPSLLARVAACAGVRVPDADDTGVAGADSDTDEEEEEEEEEERALRPRAWSRSGGDASSLPARVLASTWRLLGHYRLAAEGGSAEEEATYFLCDELGCALRHSASPNLALAPFIYFPQDGAGGVAFSLAWPLCDLEQGQEATRDLFAGEPPRSHRRAALLACFFRVPHFQCRQAWADWLRVEGAQEAPTYISVIPPPSFSSPLPPLRVYSDIDWIVDDLTHSCFTVVPYPCDADVVWTKAPLDGEIAHRLGAPPHALLNQFPGEECLVFKHLLARTCAGAAGAHGPQGWLPLTLNLESDLGALLGAHETACDAHRAAGGPPVPLWIVKPWNSGRSLDICVASCPQAVAAAARAGPKVCQAYIARPALYRGRKFDVRILLAVRAFAPLEAATWHETYIRVANRPYDTSPQALGDFQTSFTSMRQRGFSEEDVSEMTLASDLASQGLDWGAAMQRVRTMLRSLMAAASPHIGAFSRGRALYGIDVMFDEALNPKLLEVTFCPGVERPMSSDPGFLNKLFGHLILVRYGGMCASFAFAHVMRHFLRARMSASCRSSDTAIHKRRASSRAQTLHHFSLFVSSPSLSSVSLLRLPTRDHGAPRRAGHRLQRGRHRPRSVRRLCRRGLPRVCHGSQAGVLV